MWQILKANRKLVKFLFVIPKLVTERGELFWVYFIGHKQFTLDVEYPPAKQGFTVWFKMLGTKHGVTSETAIFMSEHDLKLELFSVQIWIFAGKTKFHRTNKSFWYLQESTSISMKLIICWRTELKCLSSCSLWCCLLELKYRSLHHASILSWWKQTHTQIDEF